MRIVRRAMVVGLVAGLIACMYCWTMEYRAWTAPAGSDATMAAALIFDVAARPLSYLTGGLVYEAGASSSLIVNSLQVLINWVLLALLMSLAWIAIKRLRQSTSQSAA